MRSRCWLANRNFCKVNLSLCVYLCICFSLLLYGRLSKQLGIANSKKDRRIQRYIYIHMFKNRFLCFCMITATSTCTVGGSQRPPLKRCHKKLEIHLRRRIFEQICLICVYLYFWLVNSTSSCIKQIGGP